MISIQGKGVSSGVGIGPLYFYHRTKTEIPRYTVTDPDAEWHRFKGAQTAAIEQLGELAEKARAESAPYMRQLRTSAGLRSLSVSAVAAQPKAAGKSAPPAFRQYREKDGLFYFKLATPGGAALLQSRGYANPREAAAAIALCKEHGKAALASLQDQVQLLAQPSVVEEGLQQLQSTD